MKTVSKQRHFTYNLQNKNNIKRNSLTIQHMFAYKPKGHVLLAKRWPFAS